MERAFLSSAYCYCTVGVHKSCQTHEDEIKNDLIYVHRYGLGDGLTERSGSSKPIMFLTPYKYIANSILICTIHVVLQFV